jgi:hypothetical protein
MNGTVVESNSALVGECTVHVNSIAKTTVRYLALDCDIFASLEMVNAVGVHGISRPFDKGIREHCSSCRCLLANIQKGPWAIVVYGCMAFNQNNVSTFTGLPTRRPWMMIGGPRRY